MYWRSRVGFVLLWIASVAFALLALTAFVRAGSSTAALLFLLAGAILAPPVQEEIARWINPLAPARAAVILCSTLSLVGFGYVIIDGAAAVDRHAKRLGFASGGEWARAADLKLDTPQALAAHDAAVRQKAIDRLCSERKGRPPLECFAQAHQKAALAYVEQRIPGDQFDAAVRDALAEQRKAYLASDKGCHELLDRIDEEALPRILGQRRTVIGLAGGAWARHLQARELEQLAGRAKAAAATPPLTMDPLEQKAATLAAVVEGELRADLQSWATRIVRDEPSWRTFLKGNMPLPECKPAMAAGAPADVRIAAPH